MKDRLLEINNLTVDDIKNKNNEKLEALAEIMTIEKMQSDKLGYDWEIIKIGNLEAIKKYVPQDKPKGTDADHPIIWVDGMIPINNAFYLKDGKIVVYMDGQWIDWEM